MWLPHSGMLCFHRDHDTTDLGLKLEYSYLNWEMIFLFKWTVSVFSVNKRSVHLVTSFPLYFSNRNNTSPQALKGNLYPPISQVPENTANDIFLQDVQEYWPNQQAQDSAISLCPGSFHLLYVSILLESESKPSWSQLVSSSLALDPTEDQGELM